MATSYFKYGTHTHDQGEVLLSRFYIRPNYSKRGKRYSLTKTMHLEGVLQADTQSALITKINTLISAYSTNDLHAGLYDNTGSLTPHYLDPNDANALSPVRVISRSWPTGDPTQLANRRTYSIVLAQDVVDTESQILFYYDSVNYYGTGGARYRVREYPTGAPSITQVNQYTAQRIVQSGYAVGLDAYVAHYGPMFSPPTAYELTDMRRFMLATPSYKGKDSIEYPSSWTYHFVAGTDLSSTPPILL